MSSITDELHEQLVAYLDGELDAEATRQFEEKLARDADLRRELLLLQRSWDMLDRLPRADVGAKFTRTTVEMITVAAAEDVEREQLAAPVRNLQRWAAALASIAVAAALGYGLLVWLLPQPNAQLLRDLSVIENLDLYQRGVDVDFLQQLYQEKLFAAEYDDSSPAPDASGILTATIGERRQLLEKMSPMDKEQLQQKFAKFNALPAAQQQQLRTINDQLAAEPQPDAMLATLAHYRNWLMSLPPTDRTELSELSGEKRLSRVKELKQDEQLRMLSIAQFTGFSLEDEHLVLAWYRDYLGRHGSELQKKFELDRLASTKPDDRARWDERSRMHPMYIYRAVLSAWTSADPELQATIADDDLNQLAKTLSPEAQAWLNTKKSMQDKSHLVADWVQFASSRNRFTPFGGGGRSMLMDLGRQFEQRLNDPMHKEFDKPITQWPREMQNAAEALEKFSQELPESQREQIAESPPREKFKKLSQLYRERHPKPPGNDSGPPRGFGKPPRSPGDRPDGPPNDQPPRDRPETSSGDQPPRDRADVSPSSPPGAPPPRD